MYDVFLMLQRFFKASVCEFYKSNKNRKLRVNIQE